MDQSKWPNDRGSSRGQRIQVKKARVIRGPFLLKVAAHGEEFLPPRPQKLLAALTIHLAEPQRDLIGNALDGSGMNEVRIRVPPGIAAGPGVPVRMIYIGRPSNEVTIAVQP